MTDTGPSAVFLHHRSVSLPYTAEQLGAWPELRVTMPFGAEALQFLVENECDVLVAMAEGHAEETVTFVAEARRIWPWFGLVLIGGDGATAGRIGADRHLPVASTLDSVREAFAPVGREVLARAGRPAPPPAQVSALDLVRSMAPALQRAIALSTLVGGFREISVCLTRVLPYDAISLLGIGDEPVLYLAPRKAVHMRVLEALEVEMVTRFRAITGRRIERESLRVEREGVPCDHAATGALGRSLAVPILCGREAVGLLAAADVDGSRPWTPDEVRALSLAAGQIGSVFAALYSMRGLATRDALTGVLNRMGLEDSLERTWQMSRRYGFPMGVVVVDLDHFKVLNDSYGHSVGDDVLREFAQLMKEVCRGSDIIARYGGDEFVVILPQADEAATRTFSERLIARTRAKRFCRQTQRLSLTLSIGLSTTQSPMPPATSADLLNQADRALYTSKREGRDRLCVWPENTEARLTQSPAAPVAGSDGPAPAEDAAKRGHVLVVDDEDMVRKTIHVILDKLGFDVESCSSADAAIECLTRSRQRPFDLVLTDLNMPGKSGIELLQEIASVDESVVKIVITGFATVDNAVSSLREGAYDFIQKPVRPTQLHATVKRALEYRRLKIENARYHAHLEELVRERSAQLAASLEEIRRSHEFTLEAMVAMLDARENQTGRHSVRVRDLAVALGERMGFQDDELRTLAQGALLHDIGKISVSDAILLKPGPLLREEWDIMRRHPETGYRILRSSSYLRDAAEIVWQHHESFDGTGYPRGLRGEQICIAARLFKVIDAYEAMRSERVYRGAMPVEEVARIIREGRNTAFDGAVVDAFLKYLPDLERVLSLV